ncbi:MAG: DUF2975 domain-containing protein [Planctomycetota bacterium]
MLAVPNSSDANLADTIRRRSEILRRVVWFFMGVLVLVVLASAATIIGWIDVFFVTTSFTHDLHPETPGARALMLISLLLNSAVLFKALYHLHRLFSCYRQGEYFNRAALTQIRKLGSTVVLSAVMALFTFGLLYAVARGLGVEGIPNPNFTLHVDSVFIGAVIYLVAQIMARASDLEEQQRLTI